MYYMQHLQQAINHHQQGELKRAKTIYQHLLTKQVDPNIHYLLGLLYSQEKAHLSAIRHLEQCAFQQKLNADWHNALAISYQKLGHPKVAEKLARRAISLSPRNPNDQSRLGKILLDLGQAKAATEVLIPCVFLHPEFYPACISLANSYKADNKPHAAVKTLLKAFRCFPSNPEVAFNLADSLITTGHYRFAGKLLRSLVNAGYRPAECLCQLATIRREKGQPEQALKLIQQARKTKPDNPVILWNLGLTLLLNGNLEGWQYYDHGLLIGQRKSLKSRIPRWRGEDISDKSLLILAEQGLGDQIMFASQLKPLCHFTKNITVACDPRLVPLFSRSIDDIRFISLEKYRPIDSLGFDYYIMWGSLFPLYHQFGIKIQDKGKFLQAPNEKITEENPVDKRLRVGFSWKGGTTLKEKRKRTVPLKIWHSLFDCKALFHSLQHSPDEAELDRLQQYPNVIVENKISQNRDFDFLAQRIQSLDLIITADNTVAHLSAALGKPTWCLIPFSPDWRWGIKREQSIWYKSPRLWRQTEHRNWHPVFEGMIQELTKLPSLTIGIYRASNQHT